LVAVRDRARRRGPADNRRRDIGDPVREQLDVRIVPPAGHAIGDDGRHQRFDRAKHRDRQRR
jgi:hypothetical protein